MANRKVSFSQYQMWKVCPHRWKLNYIDKHYTYTPSTAALFGTVMHEVLQEYVKNIYEKSIVEANKLDLDEMLHTGIRNEYKKLLTENNEIHFSSDKELKEYYSDGVQILQWFKAHRADFFQKKDHELVGIEVPINIVPLETHPTVKLVGFLDLVIKNTKTGDIYIYDFKTSTNGWNKYAKTDKVKTSQLLLYKTYYAKQYDVSPEQIHIEYLILRRKIMEDAEYEAMKQRVQRFEPSNGKVSQNNIKKEIAEFITTNFTEEGEYRLNVIQPAEAGRDYANCKYCEFNKNEELCPKEKRNALPF
jgi:hypothetical protein